MRNHGFEFRKESGGLWSNWLSSSEADSWPTTIICWIYLSMSFSCLSVLTQKHVFFSPSTQQAITFCRGGSLHQDEQWSTWCQKNKKRGKMAIKVDSTHFWETVHLTWVTTHALQTSPSIEGCQTLQLVIFYLFLNDFLQTITLCFFSTSSWHEKQFGLLGCISHSNTYVVLG